MTCTPALDHTWPHNLLMPCTHALMFFLGSCDKSRLPKEDDNGAATLRHIEIPLLYD